MSTAITPCKNFASVYTGIDIDPFKNLINDQTTIEEFNEKREQIANSQIFEFSMGDMAGWHPGGWHALYQAAHFGNLDLIAFIFREGGPALLELGNQDGLTPLHGAVANYKLHAASILIGLGSPINITTTDAHYDMDYGKVPPEATPLDIAVRTHNTALVVLLLMNGGKYNLPVTGHQVVHDHAIAAIETNRTQLKPVIDEATGNNTFSGELLTLIADYALSAD